MAYTIQDLLAEPELGLALVAGDADALRTEVLGAHAIEVERPTLWVPPHWIMLTNGLRLVRKVTEQRKLVRELSSHGIAALGWAEGMVFDRVPDAIIEEADARGLPVIQVPVDTAFRDIVRVVTSAATSADLRTLRRVQAIQDYLLEGMASPDGERELVDRLATTLEADVALIGSGDRVVIQRGRPIDPTQVDLLQRSTDDVAKGTMGGQRAFVVTINAGNAGEARRLIVVLRSQRVDDRSLGSLLRRVAQLFVVVARTRHRQVAAERGRLAELLLTLVNHRTPAERRQAIWQELRAGARFGDSVTWLLVLNVTQSALGPAIAAAEAMALELSIPVLTAALERDAIVAVQTPDRGTATAVARAAATAVAAPAGLSLGTEGPDGFPIALEQARAAASFARRTHADEGEPVVRSFAELDPVSWLLASSEHGVRDAKLGDFLAPIADKPQLIATLVAYHACGLSVAQTANRLHLHVNSLRYRLARIADALGVDLGDPAAIANVHVALVGLGIDEAG